MSLLLAVIVTVEGQAAGLLMVTIASEHQLDAWRTLGLPGGRVMYNAGRDSYQRPETISLCFFLLFPWCFTSTETVWVIRDGGSNLFQCVQIMLSLPVFGLFAIRTNVDACDCTRGLSRTP